MRAPFFGGGRGDWGEQDETVAVLEGGLEVEVQCIGFFPKYTTSFSSRPRTGRRRGGPTLENTGEAGARQSLLSGGQETGGGLVQLHDLLVLIQVEQSSACKSECLG
mgnify:CR=1 FL=1